MLKVILPNGSELQFTDGGQTIEQVRAAVVQLGYAAAQTAQADEIAGPTRTIRFTTPRGGEKG